MKNNQMDDEAAQKKRGIASADKIGFFERIRMGNIDDPSSEAYKKLGAGRGRSIPEASKIPTQKQMMLKISIKQLCEKNQKLLMSVTPVKQNMRVFHEKLLQDKESANCH
jgi:hypothetical protein